MLVDSRGVLWVGTTYAGLNKFDRESGKFTRYQSNPNDPNSLSYNVVNIIYEDSEGVIWVGTDEGGICQLDPNTNKFKTYRSLVEDQNASIIMSIYEDKKRNFWVGTYKTGIHLFDRKKGTSIKNYDERDGLANNLVCAILEDDSGNLWISTGNGLSKFNPATETFRNFGISDGLAGSFFNYRSAYKNKKGEMFFGSDFGLNVFHPNNIKDDPDPPLVQIANISLFNKPGERLKFDGFISELNEVKLSYDQNDLRFDFVGLHFSEPARNTYKYILEGFDRDWVDAGTQRNAVYTNLDPGEYVFKVTAANRDGVWNEEGTSILVIITPPWWATTWAYIIYALIILSVIYFTWKLQLKRIRIKHDYEMSKFEAEKMHEVDELKSRFFANISHEFRTPLTLIFGPAKDVLEETNEPKTKKNVGIIKSNASRLYNLVNQLLDLSKLESGKMKLEVSEQDIIPMLKGIFLSFTSFAERKKITLKFNTIEESLKVYIDRDKVEKIINNLLSNAFKFTPEGGKIDFIVEKLISEVEIRITDNGIGIPKERIDKIFDRFYQVDGSHTRQGEGTGIGLSLTKELVELHKGKIKVESKEGEGTTVMLQLPLGKDHLKPEEIVEKGIQEEAPQVVEEIEFISETNNVKDKTEIDVLLEMEKPLLLIVEDNSDVRSYIISHLEEDYRIQEAVDGEDGLEQALNHIPDLIISDVMMPKMDGFQLCNKLKTDEKTSHIPIIMLTAKATSKDKIKGYETGADDYIMKPFDAKELKARIQNLIALRRKLQKKFNDNDYNVPKELSEVDEKFIKKVLTVINKHKSKEKFSVEELRKETYMSTRHLQRKVMALTGKSPIQLIRSIRLNNARKQIKENKGTIAEIAYNLGFSSPAYFTKCFKDEFGYSPTDLIK
jgi:signal transduction histidine kinase/DNA-binding response OmpR family regulator/streptogramin lyase